MKRVFALVLGAVISIAVGMMIPRFLLPSPTAAERSRHSAEHQVDRSSPPASVAALGRLEPESKVLDIGVGSGVSDRLDRLLVTEGQQVEQGQVLAYLESYNLRKSERDQVAAELAEAKSRLDSETAHGNALVVEAKLAEQTLNLVSPLEIAAQEATVRRWKTELRHAEKEVKRMTDLKASDASTQQELDNQKLLEERSRDNLTNAEVVLSKLRAAQKQDLAKARAQLTTAEAALLRARAALPIASLEKRLAMTEVHMKQSVICSPISGEVLQIRTHEGEAVGNRPILRLGQTKAMCAVAEVYNTDIRFVKVGQKAMVTSPAVSEPLRGTVVRVGSLIAKNNVLSVDPTADVDARVVEVRIRLEANDLSSRLTFLQVNVVIMTGEDGGK